MSKKITPPKTIKKVQSNAAAGKNNSSIGSDKTPLIIALVLSFLIFLPSLQNAFVNWDDDVNVLENKNITSLDKDHLKAIFTDDVIGNYNPLPILTFAIEHSFVGFEPKLYHFNNLLLHLLCIFFAFLFVRQLGLSPWAAGLVALLFGIHPMRVESVAWITERKDVLFGMFYLWALWLYAKWVQTNRTNKSLYFWIFPLFVLSLLSKIQAVSLPLSMLAVDYLVKRPLKFNLIVEKIPHFLLSALFGLLGVYMLSINKSLEDVTHYTIFDRLAIGGYTFFIYMIKWIFPYLMSPLYAYLDKLNWQIYAGVIPTLGLLYLTWWMFKKNMREYAFAMLFFIFNVVFMLQILGAGQGFLADRFTYIPYLGLFYGTGYFYDQIKNNHHYKNIVNGFLVVYLLIFGVMTFQQIGIWKNGETLWTHVMKSETKTPLPFSNRAMYYRNNKMYDQALADFEKALSIKQQATTYNSMGKLFFDKGDTKKALIHYDKAIAMKGDEAEFHINRGAAYASIGQFDRALQDLTFGVTKDPENINGYLNRSLLYFTTGQYQLAINDHNEYLKRNPGRLEMYYERGVCKAALKQYASAIEDFNIAINAEKKDLFYLERGKAYFMLGKKAEAQQDVKTAIQMGLDVPIGIRQQIGIQ